MRPHSHSIGQNWPGCRIKLHFIPPYCIFTSDKGVDPERPDDLLAPAAEKVFELADPYIAAAALRETDPGKSLMIAKQNDAPWAHNLAGVILRHQLKTEEAIAEYEKAIKLDPHNPRPHHNLAIILRAQGKTKDADAQERMAEHPD
jgi:predicted Zn-dependent protease